MKLSDKILEQYKIDQDNICEKIDITAGIVESLGEDIAQYKQAYKDALFMEGEIERKEKSVKSACDHECEAKEKCKVGGSYHCSKCNSAIVRECEHRWGRTHFSNRKDKHYMVCDDCGHSTL